MEEKFPFSFGDWLQRRRKLLDLTRPELASSSGCSVSALRKIETGERRPSKQLAALLAAALDIPAEHEPTFLRVARGDLNLERLPPPDLCQTHPARPPVEPAHDSPRIPLPHSLLIGRKSEIATLRRLLANPACRMLTLTGLGGIGKTRLAVEFARTAAGLFPGGIYFAGLASLRSPEQMFLAIGEALSLSFAGSSDLRTQLLHRLAAHRDGAFLLILDNIEHLLISPDQQDWTGSVTGLLLDLLDSSPHLKILITSRERINLQAEWTFELQGLPVQEQQDSGQTQENSAAALFIQNARRINPGFQASEEDELELSRICHLTGGIPLAIELAAAWTGLLTCREIADEIQSNMDFLRTTLRDIPERHRSLRATFEYSWTLLSEDEREGLNRLAVFQGGFSRQAAGQVTGASLAVLGGLVSKSLVRRMESGRCDLHPVVRQFALSRLEEEPGCLAAFQAHSDYYLGLLAQKYNDMRGAAQVETIRELAGEMDNLRAAWAWGVQHGRLLEVGRAARSLGWLCHNRGWLQEGIEQLEMLAQGLRAQVSQTEQPDPRLQALLGEALAQQGMLFFRKGDFRQAMNCLEDSLRAPRVAGEPSSLADPLVLSGIILHLSGDLEGSRARMEAGLASAQESGDAWYTAYAIFNLGYLDGLVGRYAEGYARMVDGLNMWRELGDPTAIALGLNHISPAAIQLGRIEEAQAFSQEGFSLYEQAGDPWGMGTSCRLMGLVALAQGDTEKARMLLLKSLDLFNGYVTGWDIARSLVCLGDTSVAAGDADEARRFYLEALQQALRAHSLPQALDALTGLAYLYDQAGDAGRAFDLLLLVLRHPASGYQTKERARRLLQDLPSRPLAWNSEAASPGDLFESSVAALLIETH